MAILKYKIATHDSSTGESGKGIISWLITPFAKTQSKTIKEQYEAGCRSFDIRIKDDGTTWRCAHGLWKSKRTAQSIIEEINNFPDRCQVCITYEGKLENNERVRNLFKTYKKLYHFIIWGYLAVKYGKDSTGVKVKYDIIEPGDNGYEGGDQGFLPLDGRSWHTFIPIPWLWDKIYKRPHKFNSVKFTYVDFL